MATDGCWVHVWEHKNYGGRDKRFEGPLEEPVLGNIKWPGSNDEIGDDIDSLKTGPRTWVEVYEDENYADSVIRIGPNEHHPDLDAADMGDNIDSIRVFDRKPIHW